MPGLFVTGTDTGVGKTFATLVLLEALRRLGYVAVGMKPVAAGCELSAGVWMNDDVARIRAASAFEAPASEVNPYLFRGAVAPHIAADRKGVKIEIPVITEAYEALARKARVVVVEGAGGLLVPIDDHRDMADVMVALGLPVILVVGMRLGCINHALLTREALAVRGLRLVGWVANRVDPDMSAYAENLDALRRRIEAPLIAELPYMSNLDPIAASGYVANAKLSELLDRLKREESGRP